MSVLDMSCLRCPFDILEVMCSNYLILCCEILKSIYPCFSRTTLWLLSSWKVIVMQLLYDFCQGSSW